MRPASIVWFERLYIGSLAIAAAIMALGWDTVRTANIPLVYLLPALFVGLALPIILTLLVSRWRSRIAMWVLILLFAIGLASNLAGYNPGGGLRLDIAALTITTMQIVAIFLLFTAPARAWLAGKDETILGPRIE